MLSFRTHTHSSFSAQPQTHLLAPLLTVLPIMLAPSFCMSGTNKTVKGLQCSPNAIHGWPSQWGLRLQIWLHCTNQKSRPLNLFSFPENLQARQREPLSSPLQRPLPRPVAQVSHAAPISQPAFFLCLEKHRTWPLLPSLTLPNPPPLWALVPGYGCSEVNLDPGRLGQTPASCRAVDCVGLWNAAVSGWPP